MTMHVESAVAAPNPVRMYASSRDAGVRPPARVLLPDLSLIGRFSQEFADRMLRWGDLWRRAEDALSSAEDARPGGRVFVGAIRSAAVAARDAFASGADTWDEELSLAEFLRDEHSRRIARAVVAIAEADVTLDQLLADIRADNDLRERVAAEIELWVREACRRVDSDAPGVVEQIERENSTDWAPLAGLLMWLHNPAAGYRPRPAGRGDVRVAEALSMSDMRHGRDVRSLPYRGTSNGDNVSDEVGPSGRYDVDGHVVIPLVVVEDPASPQALGPPPSSQIEPKARTRWGRSA